MNVYDAQQQLEEEQERIERELSIKRRAYEYILELDDDEDVNINEIYRSIAEQDEYNFQRAEENSLRNSWQQDLIDLYRFER